MKILLLEDDEAIGVGLKYSLENEGYCVQIVKTVKEALEQVRAGIRSLCDHLDHNVDRLTNPEKRYHRGSAERRCLLRRPHRHSRIHPSEIQAQAPAAQG